MIYARPKQTILEAESEAAKSKHSQVTLQFLWHFLSIINDYFLLNWLTLLPLILTFFFILITPLFLYFF